MTQDHLQTTDARQLLLKSPQRPFTSGEAGPWDHKYWQGMKRLKKKKKQEIPVFSFQNLLPIASQQTRLLVA